MTESNITIDDAYEAVAPDDFQAMIEVDRYGGRSTVFDKIISATHDHFWDPLDVRYVDFSKKFDLENEYLMPETFVGDFASAIVDKLDHQQKCRLMNESVRITLSGILHGEQGALSLSASLCHILKDPGAQEYAANQAREEARHVTAFTRYIGSLWGTPRPIGPVLKDLLIEMVHSPLVWKKLVGMQLVLEGLAMGIFSTLHNKTNDPVLKQMIQLVMTDEAFHHKFGKIWADRTIPKLDPAERDLIEDWAYEVFATLLHNSIDAKQKAYVYEELGIDWQWAQGALREAMTDDIVRRRMQSSTNIFRVLIRTLLRGGIITERTAPKYAAYVDMAELHAEGDKMPGDEIAEAGIKYLKAINGGDDGIAGELLTAAE
jgi:hypothetical protein